MKIDWTTDKKYKPEIIIERLNSIRIIRDNGSIALSSFEANEVIPVLKSSLIFPENVTSHQKETYIYDVIFSLKEILTKDNLLNEINKVYVVKNTVRITEYVVFTSISITKNAIPKKLVINNVSIKTCDKISKTFTDNRLMIIRGTDRDDAFQKDYTLLMLTVNSRDIENAVLDALYAVDILRGWFCLRSNSFMEISSNEWTPINTVRLGRIHTVHLINGIKASSLYWYSDNYLKINAFVPKNIEVYNKNTKYFLNMRKKCSYKDILDESLVRFVRALDEENPSTTLLKIWTALEHLTGTNNAKYDELTRRASSVSKDYLFRQQMLEHLRDVRNRTVHTSEEFTELKIDCFNAQNIFLELFLFHLSNTHCFETFNEVNMFLDLTRDVSILKRKKWMLDKAINFRNTR